MADYSRLTQEQLHLAAAKFDIRFSEATFIDGGLAKTNYRLMDESGALYVLTVADNERNLPAGVTARLLHYVAEHGILTSQPVASLDGNFLESLDGHCILVKHYIEGATSHVLPTGMLAEAGALLARIHQLPVPPWLPGGTRRMDDAEESVAHFDDHVFAGWVLNQLDETRAIFAVDEKPCINHGDYFGDNLILTAGEGIGVIDWDTASVELPVVDLGFAVVGLACTNAAFEPDRLRLVLDGYEAIRPLSAAARESLLDASVYAATVLAHHRYRRFHVLFPEPAKFEAHREMQNIVTSLRAQWTP
jgi:homoserine kinase type II